MIGKEVYEKATTAVPECIREVLRINGLGLEDVSMIIPHQATARVLKRIAEVPLARVHRRGLNLGRKPMSMVSPVLTTSEEVLSQLIALAGFGLVRGNRVSSGLVHALPISIVETAMVFARNFN